MKWLLLFIIGISLLSVSFASPELFYREGTTIDLKVPCSNDGFACNSSVNCNISVSFPNGDTLIDNKAMTYNSNYFNYTLNESDVLGEYKTIIFCSSGTVGGYNAFTFRVNASGENNENIMALMVFLIISIIICLVLTVVFYIKESMMMYMFLILTMGFATATAYFGLVIAKDYGATLATVAYTIYLGILLLTFVVVLIIIVEIIIKTLNLFRKGGNNKGYEDNLI
jgi:hypothetical protein